MKATALSISLPYYGCNKDCPYCVSKMTGYVESNPNLFYRNITKAAEIARRCGVIYLSITSKGEPFFNENSTANVFSVMDRVSRDFSCEIQTNFIGVNESRISLLYECGIDTFAISIDHKDTLLHMWEVITGVRKLDGVSGMILRHHSNIMKTKELGITLRATVNLTPDTYTLPPEDYVELCKIIGIDQLSFRRITIPEKGTVYTPESTKTKEWIDGNIDRMKEAHFIKSYEAMVKNEGKLVMELPYGAYLYNVKGISVAYFDYCIQESSKDNDIRSLILHEDGHMSTSWYGSNYGRIF